MSIKKEENKIKLQNGFVLLLTKVNAIGLLTHSYQKSCALRGFAVHKTRIYNLEKKFGVWALPNEKAVSGQTPCLPKRKSLAYTHIGVYTRTAFTEMVRF